MNDRAARARLQSQMFPDWSLAAACRSFSATGTHWEWMFADEESQLPDTLEYEWSEAALEAMRVCARCPVRRPCLEWAYDFEKSEGQQWWSGELVEQDRRFGIYGGVPGKQRERFAASPDRLERSAAWFEDFARRKGWIVVSRERGACRHDGSVARIEADAG